MSMRPKFVLALARLLRLDYRPTPEEYARRAADWLAGYHCSTIVEARAARDLDHWREIVAIIREQATMARPVDSEMAAFGELVADSLTAGLNSAIHRHHEDDGRDH